jgi:hypothetical protein
MPKIINRCGMIKKAISLTQKCPQKSKSIWPWCTRPLEGRDNISHTGGWSDTFMLKIINLYQKIKNVTTGTKLYENMTINHNKKKQYVCLRLRGDIICSCWTYRVQHQERCKIVKSVTPEGVTDFTILHLSRCLILFLTSCYVLMFVYVLYSLVHSFANRITGPKCHVIK